MLEYHRRCNKSTNYFSHYSTFTLFLYFCEMSVILYFRTYIAIEFWLNCKPHMDYLILFILITWRKTYWNHQTYSNLSFKIVCYWIFTIKTFSANQCNTVVHTMFEWGIWQRQATLKRCLFPNFIQWWNIRLFFLSITWQTNFVGFLYVL